MSLKRRPSRFYPFIIILLVVIVAGIILLMHQKQPKADTTSYSCAKTSTHYPCIDGGVTINDAKAATVIISSAQFPTFSKTVSSNETSLTLSDLPVVPTQSAIAYRTKISIPGKPTMCSQIILDKLNNFKARSDVTPIDAALPAGFGGFYASDKGTNQIDPSVKIRLLDADGKMTDTTPNHLYILKPGQYTLQVLNSRLTPRYPWPLPVSIVANEVFQQIIEFGPANQALTSHDQPPLTQSPSCLGAS